MATNGTTFNVYVDGTEVASSTSAELSMNVAEIDVSSKDSLGNKEILPGQKDWSISGDFLENTASSNYNFSDFYALYQNRTVVSIKFSEETSSNKYYIGQAYLTSVSASAPMEDAVTGSFTFVGTGKLSEKTFT